MPPTPLRSRILLILYLGSVFAALPLRAQRGDAPDTRLRPPAEQRALFQVPPGFEVQLVASEPEIQKPMNVAFDAAGRVWVTGSVLYPWPARRDAVGNPIAAFQKNWDDNQLAFRATSTPPEPAEYGLDSVRILSDFGPDGRARRVTVFADGLNIPIGVLPLPRLQALSPSKGPAPTGDSALVFSIPAIWKLTDTDGDGRADTREKLYDGFGFKDTHGMSSSYWLWYDGWVYGTHGFANASEVTDRAGNVTKLTSGNTYRFRPDGSRFELFARGQTNPFGLAFDARGDVYTADSHSKPVYLLVPGGYYEGINREHDGLGFAPAITTDDHGSSAIAGLAHYSADHFPREFRDTLYNGNPVTRRVNRARLDWRGSSPTAVRQSDFLTSDDPAFRPVQVKLGPDGALWIADFYNPIIGHYEVPLTHPARDRTHGRLWRVVWRGLDGSAPVPTLPDLTRETTAALVSRLSDPNLVVRSLAVSEFLIRSDAAAHVPLLRAAAAALVSGRNPSADETATLPLLLTLDRLGQGDDALLRQAFERPGSGAALAALRTLAARDRLPPEAMDWFTRFVAAGPSEHALRILAELCQRHPADWQPALLLPLLAKTPASDFELTYALRLALKQHALTADIALLRTWAAGGDEAAGRIAEICLAVPTPAAATFLLEHLERTRAAAPRAGELARHAIQHLPPAALTSLRPLLDALERSGRTQRLAVAEGLALLAAKADRVLPDDIHSWMERELLAAIDDKDQALALRAINVVKPLALAAKAATLRRVALAGNMRESNRVAALRALTPDAAETTEVLITVLGGNGSNLLRRTAAELLGTAKASPDARTALVAAVPTASADLTLALAAALAKSDAGAAELVDLAAAGRVRPALLKHRHLVLAFEARPPELRARVAALTRDLPPEDARLDALIAQRLGAAGAASAKADATRGAELFQRHCAACHRFKDSGGNLGPSLDGIGSRSLPRLVEDILDPSRNVDPAFRLTTVTLHNGETRSGLNLRESADRIQLTDPANGQDATLPRGEIAAIAASPVSPMPAAFDSVLSESEFFDLLEFLRQPATAR
jgi:putative membrane-bound dehydrogenase-like protein